MRIFIVFLFMLFVSSGHNDKITWNETGHTPLSDIKSGIQVFDKLTISYKRSGEKVLKIKAAKPVIIGVADKEEKWGHFQFPVIYRSLDNSLVAQWNMSADAIASYGKGGHSYSVSVNGGKSWSAVRKDPVIGGGLIMPNGDRIKIHTPEALKTEDIRLPEPIKGTYSPKGYTFYKVSELPEQLQGVYISRLRKDEAKWNIEHSVLNDPLAVRYDRGGLLPVVWWGDMHIASDGVIYAGVYPSLVLNDYGKVDPSGVSFYSSTDEGHTWNLHSRIPYLPDLEVDPNGNKRTGFGWTEPAFEILSDGSFLCVMRTSDGLGISPMYKCRSTDLGKTWTKPEAFTRNGVLPRLLQLKNGVLVLASGRPGVQLRFSIDGKGEKWTDPLHMLPFADIKESVSCGYTEILETGPDRFLLIYSDFKFINEQGEIRKAIKVREIRVTINKVIIQQR